MNAIAPIPEAPEDEALRAECRRLQEAGLSFKAQAKEAGIPYGTFTNWVGGTYGASTERIAADVDKWLRSRIERAATAAAIPAGPASFVLTPTAKDITNLLSYAQTAPDIIVWAGGAGTSKTSTALHYKATHPNVWLVTMRPTTSGTHTMLAEIAEVMGIEERMSARLTRTILRKVKERTGGLLILDEAQHLSTAALDEIRSLFDIAELGIGLALIGNETVYTRLEGQGRQTSLSQLYSRVGMRKTQSKARTEDVTALVAAWGIDDPKMVKTLIAIAGKPGALRGVTKTLRLAGIIAAGSGEALADSHLRAAWRQLGNTQVE